MTDSNTTIFPERIQNFAGFWARLFASLIDGLILLPLMFGIHYLLGGSFTEPVMAGTILGYALSLLYSAFLESGPNQATIGKRALDIKVSNLEGERISFGRATGRHFGKYLSLIILGIGYLMMLWDPKKQTLHDKLAGTLVQDVEQR
jgi:uncharacterized RDD family membrane protein YckC